MIAEAVERMEQQLRDLESLSRVATKAAETAGSRVMYERHQKATHAIRVGKFHEQAVALLRD